MKNGRVLLNDAAIRGPLAQRLADEASAAANAIVVHEFSISGGYGYADLASINGEFVGYEIKSDVDSLARLRGQVETFNGVFDRMWLVTTTRHEAAARKIIPEWWGILLAEGDPVRFLELRPAGLNRDLDLPLVLDLLYLPELARVATRAGCRGHSRLSKAELCFLVAERLPIDTIRKVVRGHLYDQSRYFPKHVVAAFTAAVESAGEGDVMELQLSAPRQIANGGRSLL